MLIRYAPMHSPCDPAAGLMHLPTGRQKGRRWPAATRRPFALVTRCQGALENEKMSELPNLELAGQEVGGFGAGFGVIPCTRFSR